ECDQSIVGLITMQGGSRKRIYHWAEIALSVSKKYWGMRIGRALIELAIEHAEKNGITRIGLKVRTDNDRATALYRKMGFEIEGRLKKFMKVNDHYFDFYQMSRDV
ncbi:MAG: GNAT family N-acetyltransferase, partial [Kosmotogaceae bacterium]|nr:GNAT family N-acetyltransferase [Kosmotogaceae bacterium]